MLRPAHPAAARRAPAAWRAPAARRALVLAVLACAMLVRAMLPVGWMPTTGADGGTIISLCSGMGAVEMVVARDGTLHPKAPARHDGTAEHSCAFAGVGQAFAATAPIIVHAPAFDRFAVPAVRRVGGAVGRGLAAPPPPPTGPPLLV